MKQNDLKLITAEECSALADTMNSKYRIAMKGRTFQIKVEQVDSDLNVCVTLKNEDESFYYPVEARIKFEAEEMTANEAALFLLDYIDVYFEEFLLEEEEQLYLPIDWKDFEYEAVSFQMKGQILNKSLENLADEWLRKGEIH